jgi:glycosyltransferase involved in cell wall biosynthesis
VKVLHVITGLGIGGAETQLRSLVAHSRHESEVVCLYNPGPIAAELRAAGVRVVDLGMRSNRDVAAVRRLASVMRAGCYDVVHTHLYRACIYGRLAARLASVPVIVATEHSLQDGQLEGRVATRSVRALYRASEALGDVTIAVSAAVRGDLLGWGVPADRVVQVPNGVELGALVFDPAERATTRGALGLYPEAQVIGAVGRLHPGKRFDFLLESTAPLLHRGRHLLVVGDGPQRDRLEEQAADLGVADQVIFVGERSPRPFLAAMDVFASPSLFETFGLSVVEALANGLPVAYRRCPALEELESPVPGAVWVGHDADMRAVLHRLLTGTRAADRAAPAELSALGMVEIARAVDDVYERVTDGGYRPATAGAMEESGR